MLLVVYLRGHVFFFFFIRYVRSSSFIYLQQIIFWGEEWHVSSFRIEEPQDEKNKKDSGAPHLYRTARVIFFLKKQRYLAFFAYTIGDPD